MFKDFFSSIFKFATKKEFIALVVFLILLWALMSYSNNKKMVLDGMDGGVDSSANKLSGNVAPADVQSSNSQSAAGGYDFRSVTNPTDLLPQDQNSEWAALNPVNQGNAAMPDLLQAGYHIGLDTIGQTLRNPNYQLRSDPIIPKSDIGPWNQSTIEPDLGRVPLEVGCGSR
jgi:hypothetical protein